MTRDSLFRHILRLALLLSVACTKLEGKNDRFGSASGGTKSSSNLASIGGSGGDGGQSAEDTVPITGATGGVPSSSSNTAVQTALGGATASDSWTSLGGGSVGGSTPTASCTDPSGFGSLGCYSCTPADITTLESACTDASCVRFGNRERLTKLGADGSLPPLPQVSNGGTSGGGMGSGTASGGTASGGTASGGTASGGTASGGGMGGTDSSGSSKGGASNTVGSSPVVGGTTSSLPYCDNLTAQGTAVYVTGSSAAKPFLQQIAQQLASLRTYVVYTSTGSCVGVDAILNQTPMMTGAAPAPTTSAVVWDSSSSTGKACLLDATGVTADIGISDVFAQTCPGFELASVEGQQVRDAHGPIQPMAFVVPTNSQFSQISAQAAYFVYGLGKDGGVLDPGLSQTIWSDEEYLFQRNASSGTQAMIATAIGVPGVQWKGKTHKTSDDLAAAIQAASSSATLANKTLGILAADYIDSKNLRAQIRMLAFQDTNQPCAFFPDSTESARDKRNVRDGHYPIWSPLHLLYRVDASGNPANAQHRQPILDILGYLSGTRALPNGIKLLDVYAQSGLVPECAMRVARLKDGGNLVPMSPSSPCACLFELKATGTTNCRSCDVQGDCNGGEACSLGYCEK